MGSGRKDLIGSLANAIYQGFRIQFQWKEGLPPLELVPVLIPLDPAHFQRKLRPPKLFAWLNHNSQEKKAPNIPFHVKIMWASCSPPCKVQRGLAPWHPCPGPEKRQEIFISEEATGSILQRRMLCALLWHYTT